MQKWKRCFWSLLLVFASLWWLTLCASPAACAAPPPSSEEPSVCASAQASRTAVPAHIARESESVPILFPYPSEKRTCCAGWANARHRAHPAKRHVTACGANIGWSLKLSWLLARYQGFVLFYASLAHIERQRDPSQHLIEAAVGAFQHASEPDVQGCVLE